MIDCAVIGGGVAGLTAAVELASKGRTVALFEALPHLGGRAWSFPDAAGGSDIDNGQHLLMGCYTSTMRLLRLLGSDSLLERIERMRIPFRKAGGAEAVLRIGRLPGGAGMAQAFLGYRFLSLGERLSALRLALSLRSLSEQRLDALDDVTSAEWLRSFRQSRNAIETLWRPIVLATMNADVDEASAKLLAVLLREIFLGPPGSSALLIPGRGLSDLFGKPALAWLTKRGVAVHQRLPVKQLLPLHGVVSIVDREGGKLAARTAVVAVPPWALKLLIESTGILAPLAASLDGFQPSSIVSASVWSRREFTAQPMTGLLGTTLQWVFSKGREQNDVFRYSCTVSAARKWDAIPPADFENIIGNDLRLLYPSLRAEDIARVRIVRERAATFLPSPGLERRRPHARMQVPGLFIAGDWTGTGLPATIEGAARSGESAAAAAIDYLNRAG